MPNDLTIAVAQPESTLHDVTTNAARHADAIAEAAARVVVFPELSLTGYSMDVRPVAVDDDRLAPVRTACSASGCIALVGAPTLGADGRSRISMLRIDGDGVTVAYDKMWLGGDEPNHFGAGDRPSVITIDGWRLGLAICRDTGVGEHARVSADLGMDVYVAGVCEHERDRDVQPERMAGVIAEHAVWGAVASFAGPTGGGFGDTAGRSAVWRPDGSASVVLGREPGRVGSAALRAEIP